MVKYVTFQLSILVLQLISLREGLVRVWVRFISFRYSFPYGFIKFKSRLCGKLVTITQQLEKNALSRCHSVPSFNWKWEMFQVHPCPGQLGISYRNSVFQFNVFWDCLSLSSQLLLWVRVSDFLSGISLRWFSIAGSYSLWA